MDEGTNTNIKSLEYLFVSSLKTRFNGNYMKISMDKNRHLKIVRSEHCCRLARVTRNTQNLFKAKAKQTLFFWCKACLRNICLKLVVNFFVCIFVFLFLSRFLKIFFLCLSLSIEISPRLHNQNQRKYHLHQTKLFLFLCGGKENNFMAISIYF